MPLVKYCHVISLRQSPTLPYQIHKFIKVRYVVVVICRGGRELLKFFHQEKIFQQKEEAFDWIEKLH